MANNITVKDSAGANATLKTTDNAGVHTPHHNVDTIAAGDNNIGNVDIVSLPAGNLGMQAMAASQSVVPASNITDATYIGDIKFGEALPAGTATIGATQDAGPSWTSVFGVTSAAVVSADMTTAAAVTAAPTAGQKLVIIDIVVSTDTAMNVLFEEETSGTDIFKIFLPANGTVQITPRGKIKLATADKKLTGKASVAGNIAVTVTYFSEA